MGEDVASNREDRRAHDDNAVIDGWYFSDMLHPEAADQQIPKDEPPGDYERTLKKKPRLNENSHAQNMASRLRNSKLKETLNG